MVRVPQVGEPPAHSPSWLELKLSKIQEYKNLKLNNIYLITIPPKWFELPIYDLNDTLVEVKAFDPHNLLSSYNYDVYVINPFYTNKIAGRSSNGQAIEYVWYGVNSTWLSFTCKCLIKDLMVKGCLCGGK